MTEHASLSSGLSLSVTSSTPDTIISIDTLTQRKRLGRLRVSLLNTLQQCDKDAKRIGYQGWFVTATYRNGVVWSPLHISHLMHRIRMWAKRVKYRHLGKQCKGFTLSGGWACELMQNGRPHYHIVLYVPIGLVLPKPDKQAWWRHGFTERTRIRYSGAAYLSKYLSKSTSKDKDIPKGCRLSAAFGLSTKGKRVRTHFTHPKWLREMLNRFEDAPLPLPAGFTVEEYLRENPEWNALHYYTAKRIGAGFWYCEELNFYCRSPYYFDTSETKLYLCAIRDCDSGYGLPEPDTIIQAMQPRRFIKLVAAPAAYIARLKAGTKV